jgi:Domain of unknown function (DUF4365)
MENTGLWYIDQRAEQLAFVYLSRRDDLIIHKQDNDHLIDYLVTITENGNYTGKMFGVQVKAQLSIKPAQCGAFFTLDLESALIPEDIPFPLCLFVFSMDTDVGYYRWLKEPKFDAIGTSTLAVNQVNTFKQLTKDEFNRIIHQITLWYERQPHQAVVA